MGESYVKLSDMINRFQGCPSALEAIYDLPTHTFPDLLPWEDKANYIRTASVLTIVRGVVRRVCEELDAHSVQIPAVSDASTQIPDPSLAVDGDLISRKGLKDEILSQYPEITVEWDAAFNALLRIINSMPSISQSSLAVDDKLRERYQRLIRICESYFNLKPGSYHSISHAFFASSRWRNEALMKIGFDAIGLLDDVMQPLPPAPSVDDGKPTTVKIPSDGVVTKVSHSDGTTEHPNQKCSEYFKKSGNSKLLEMIDCGYAYEITNVEKATDSMLSWLKPILREIARLLAERGDK